MCGFAGFLQHSGLDETAETQLRFMTDAIAHRGPDDAGYWLAPEQGIALGHRRLSIIDLSPAGHQPMHSPCGRYTIVFNGEIYNYANLRDELETVGGGQDWRGHSDTEILLAAFAHWGVEATLTRCVGMFALALWDAKERNLSLARDRMGEKPLYYGWCEDRFVFASELASFRAQKNWHPEVDRQAVALMMRYNCIPAPYSIYKGIYKLCPGQRLVLQAGQKAPTIQSYWTVADVAIHGINNHFTGSAQDAVDAFERLLKQSIKGQMMADVPLGCFLSGGVDSSTIAALMQAMSDQPVKTFSIGFDEESYNEAGYARAVAKHLKTDHTEMIVSAQQARDVIPHLSKIYSEPFSDSSQISTYLVSQLARTKVTVSLSGDAGDELFSGYRRYALGDGFWQKLSLIPVSLRKIAASGIYSVSPETWSRLFSFKTNAGDKLHKLASIMGSCDEEDVYTGLVSHWRDPATLVLNSTEPETGKRTLPTMPNFVQQMMLWDQTRYLSDDILVKVDRASMAVGLESRVPLLDHRLVEFSWTLPLSILRHEGQSKWLLRELLYRHVPRKLIERPKVGFGIPLDSWLRKDLREWAEDLLSEKRLREDGFFDKTMVRQAWAEHLSGRANRAYLLWDVLMFQSWQQATIL